MHLFEVQLEIFGARQLSKNTFTEKDVIIKLMTSLHRFNFKSVFFLYEYIFDVFEITFY